MYFIVNYERWWNYKRPFAKFHDAFMMQQLIDPDANIEYFDGVSREVVWNPLWETYWC